MTTQKEVIIWHKYPEEKPTEKYVMVNYLIHHADEWVGEMVWVKKDSAFYFMGEDNNPNGKIDNADIIAWAEMPKGIENSG